MNATRRTGILLALATAGISGVSVFVNARGVKTFESATVYTTAKNVVAALLLLGVVTLGARTGAPLTRPSGPRQWWALGAVGLVGGSVSFVLFFEGLARATSPQAAFIHKTLVLWVALLAVPLLGERLQWGHWLPRGDARACDREQDDDERGLPRHDVAPAGRRVPASASPSAIFCWMRRM